MIFTARIDRAHSDRARSASSGNIPIAPAFFSILLVIGRGGWAAYHDGPLQDCTELIAIIWFDEA